jgi:hypothetical protein
MLVYEERTLSIGKECRERSSLPGCGVSPPTPKSAAEGGARKKIKQVTKKLYMDEYK